MRKLVVVGALATMALACWGEFHAASDELRTIRVGPYRKITQPSQAAKIAVDGSIVEIDAGVYPRDSAVWRQNNLTLRGVGGRVHLQSEGKTSQGKAIWVIKGDNTRVENIEFSGARVEDHNGAGIRQEGSGLTIAGCSFHDNENGLLSGGQPESEIVIENSEFFDNGYGDGRTHNIYIGRIKSLIMRHSYVHHAKVGHNVKTRAGTNYILYNRIMDEKSGTASYAIDLPEGGNAFVIGNVIQQGPEATNSSIINYASKVDPETGRLYFVNNTVVNDRHTGIFLQNHSARPAHVVNNIFAGRGPVIRGQGKVAGNLLVAASSSAPPKDNRVATTAKFVNQAGYDYRLAEGSPAINAAIDAGKAPFPLTPVSEYVHRAKQGPRPHLDSLDIGAFEFSGP